MLLGKGKGSSSGRAILNVEDTKSSTRCNEERMTHDEHSKAARPNMRC